MNSRVFIAIAAVIAAAVVVLSIFPAVGNIISDRNSFAFCCNHRVFVYDSGGKKLAEIDVRELGNAKLVEFGDRIVVYSANRGFAAYYAVSGDRLYDGYYDDSAFVNTRNSPHTLSDGAEVIYTKILCYEQIKLINGDKEIIVYNNIWLILTMIAAFLAVALIWYLKINFWKQIDENSADNSGSTAD